MNNWRSEVLERGVLRGFPRVLRQVLERRRLPSALNAGGSGERLEDGLRLEGAQGRSGGHGRWEQAGGAPFPPGVSRSVRVQCTVSLLRERIAGIFSDFLLKVCESVALSFPSLS